MKGKVLWFNQKKGYGFISADDPAVDRDIFVHYTGIDSPEKRKNLEDEQMVDFELTKGAKGPMAINVRVI